MGGSRYVYASTRISPSSDRPMPDAPQVILSGFADEAANQKTAVQQFAAFAALGLQYYSVRFVDVGGGVKNVMKLNKSELTKLRHLENEYGMNVASIGSPIGKVKLCDVDDGTHNAYVPFKKYLDRDVAKACEMAHAFETKLIRGFSFYHPKGSDPWEHIPQAVDQLGQIAEACHRSDLTFGLEIEANLVGQTGQLLAEIHRQVNHPAMVLIFDAANILCQGFSPAELFEQYLAMKPGIGWMHIKDYRHPHTALRTDHVDEESIEIVKNMVPADMGDAAHEVILRDFGETIPKLARKLQRRGIPGVFLDLEPHVKGGGQFGGFSGPDGFGVALRGLCRVLDYCGFDYHLRDFDDIRADRGF
jgi:sugar phosphate isomerase/epimerase